MNSPPAGTSAVPVMSRGVGRVAHNDRSAKIASLTIWSDGLVKKKKVIHREWTKDDIYDLKLFAKQKIGVAKLAKRLKRTAGATAAKAHTLGVSLNTRA